MITLSHLRKTFGDLVAVEDLSLEIKPGEILGFLGPNGAGKTTTIKMICGLLQSDGGDIHWMDSNLSPSSRIGLCTQENIYWPRLTCSEQLQFQGRIQGLSAKSSLRRTDQLLTDLGLLGKAQVLAEKLSGGMKRRLNIALALIHDPPVLILDEPEAGLDPQSRILVRELIRSLSRTKTVILTTHNMDEAERLAGRVAIIDNGRILCVDTVDALKRILGEADVLELTLSSPPEKLSLSDIATGLDLPAQALTLMNDTLRITRSGMLNELPQRMTLIKKLGLEYTHMAMRAITLEDVFIHLTGKGLRE
jgi:ABC-2 type transport system ATP-binding protein